MPMNLRSSKITFAHAYSILQMAKGFNYLDVNALATSIFVMLMFIWT